MHHNGIPRDTQSMIADNILTEISGNSNEKLHCGNVVNMPFCTIPVSAALILIDIMTKTEQLLGTNQKQKFNFFA